MGRPRKYLTEEDKKLANREKQARWYSLNKGKVSEYKRKFYRRKKN
jgi:hypothetical protein